MLSPPKPQVSPERLMQFTFGFAPPLMIETALRYGVFDILDKEARSLEVLCVGNWDFGAWLADDSGRLGGSRCAYQG
jgi:hypothetical protein